jgi:hypothetical protein
MMKRDRIGMLVSIAGTLAFIVICIFCRTDVFLIECLICLAGSLLVASIMLAFLLLSESISQRA